MQQKVNACDLEAWKQAFQTFSSRTCLITGAPRSGTTALLQWLCRQEGIVGYNESRVLLAHHRYLLEVERFEALYERRQALLQVSQRALYEYYQGEPLPKYYQWLCQKEPLERIALPHGDYFSFLRHVQMLLPGSKRILLIRDPISTVNSMSQRSWGISLNPPQSRRFSIGEYIRTWKVCALCVLNAVSDADSYICQYGRLVKHPEFESKAIQSFLGLASCSPFIVQPKQALSLSNRICEHIQAATAELVSKLSAVGIDQLDN